MTSLGSFVRFGAASSAVTTEAPHWRESRRGRIPEEPLALYEAGTVTLCSQPKSSPYLNYLIRLAPGLRVNGIMIDLDDNRLKVAKRFGATAIVNATDGKAAEARKTTPTSRKRDIAPHEDNSD